MFVIYCIYVSNTFIYLFSSFQTLTMLIAVVATYALSWLPIHTINLIGENDPEIYDDKAIHITWLFFTWLALSNSGANPIIYCWMNEKFRRGFLLIFHCITCSRFRHFSALVYSKMSTRYFSRRGSVTRDIELVDANPESVITCDTTTGRKTEDI